jgi:hypothetical protein
VIHPRRYNILGYRTQGDKAFWDMRLKHAIFMRGVFIAIAPPLFIITCLAPAPVSLWIAQHLGVYFIVFIGFLFLMGIAVLLVGWAHRITVPIVGFDTRNSGVSSVLPTCWRQPSRDQML